jgi:hypothetical protein
MPLPCDMCLHTPGKYHFDGDSDAPCPFCDGTSQTDLRIHLIKETIPLLWNYPQGIPRSQWRGSYGAKHGVEHALGLYITNDQFIQAAVDLGIQHEKGDPNYRFGMKPRFPTEWFQSSGRLTTRPPRERVEKWNAYLGACKEIDRLWNATKDHMETTIDYQQDLLREMDGDLNLPIMKLKTREEKVRYALYGEMAGVATTPS